MTKAKSSDKEFIALAKKNGPAAIARILSTPQRAIYQRRRSLENKYKITISWPTERYPNLRPSQYQGRLDHEIPNGVAIVGSDFHYWPGPPSLMHKAFLHFCRELKPELVVANGDVLDFCKISRHPPIGWTHQPTPQEEIEAAQERMHEIEKASGKARKVWPLGNHDSRFETRLATVAPEFAKIVGTRLSDHFPLWEPCWSVWVNDRTDTVVIKHRGNKSGIHATYNNVKEFRTHVVSSHSHMANVRPVTDIRRETLYGVDTGCIADPLHSSFVDYKEGSITDWRDGFCVLTFQDGRLLLPELVTRCDDTSVQFRGKTIKV
jgi:hypothetical protein